MLPTNGPSRAGRPLCGAPALWQAFIRDLRLLGALPAVVVASASGTGLETGKKTLPCSGRWRLGFMGRGGYLGTSGIRNEARIIKRSGDFEHGGDEGKKTEVQPDYGYRPGRRLGIPGLARGYQAPRLRI